MGWDRFIEMERMRLRQRRAGQLRSALGVALPGETVEELDRLGKQDRLRAKLGLVAVMSMDGPIFYKPLDNLGTLEMRFRTAAERIEVAWLKERLECRRNGAPPPPIPRHLA
jgi:hypothetical protein